jgi:response regulator RpfG family c-di-GMP phosphodiesterase
MQFQELLAQMGADLYVHSAWSFEVELIEQRYSLAESTPAYRRLSDIEMEKVQLLKMVASLAEKTQEVYLANNIAQDAALVAVKHRHSGKQAQSEEETIDEQEKPDPNTKSV